MTGGWRIAACGVLWIALAQPPAVEVPPLTDAEVGAALACGADPACRIPEVPFGGKWLVVTQGSITTNVGYISQLARQAQQRHAPLAIKDVSSRLRFHAWIVTAKGQAPTRMNYAAVQSVDRLLLFAAGPDGKPLERPIPPVYTERLTRDWGSAASPITTRSVTAYFDPADIPAGDFSVVTIGTLTQWHEVRHASLVKAGLAR